MIYEGNEYWIDFLLGVSAVAVLLVVATVVIGGGYLLVSLWKKFGE